MVKKSSTNKVKTAAAQPKENTKKVAKKKTTPAKPAMKRDAQEKSFILVNGKKLKNIKELADVMDEIEDYVFNHHVTADKNDFANWLNDVFNEIELAKEVAGCNKKKHVQLVLYKHISHKLW